MKVNVFWPEDITELENKFIDVLSDTLVRKLDKAEINKLIDILETTSIS
ncbi:MAG: hypothetical protein RSA29_17815 [Clostridium sp.]